MEFQIELQTLVTIALFIAVVVKIAYPSKRDKEVKELKTEVKQIKEEADENFENLVKANRMVEESYNKYTHLHESYDNLVIQLNNKTKSLDFACGELHRLNNDISKKNDEQSLLPKQQMGRTQTPRIYKGDALIAIRDTTSAGGISIPKGQIVTYRCMGNSGSDVYNMMTDFKLEGMSYQATVKKCDFEKVVTKAPEPKPSINKGDKLAAIRNTTSAGGATFVAGQIVIYSESHRGGGWIEVRKHTQGYYHAVKSCDFAKVVTKAPEPCLNKGDELVAIRKNSSYAPYLLL